MNYPQLPLAPQEAITTEALAVGASLAQKVKVALVMATARILVNPTAAETVVAQVKAVPTAAPNPALMANHLQAVPPALQVHLVQATAVRALANPAVTVKAVEQPLVPQRQVMAKAAKAIAAAKALRPQLHKVLMAVVVNKELPAL